MPIFTPDQAITRYHADRAACVSAIGMQAWTDRQILALNRAWHRDHTESETNKLWNRIQRGIVDLWLLQNC